MGTCQCVGIAERAEISAVSKLKAYPVQMKESLSEENMLKTTLCYTPCHVIDIHSCQLSDKSIPGQLCVRKNHN